MSTSADAVDSNNSSAATLTNQQQQASSMTYPYLELLNRLQAISSTRKNTDDDIDRTEDLAAVDPNNDSAKDSNPQWDLSTDAQLATLLHELSSHIQSRTHHVSSKIRALQNAVNQAGVEVALVQQQWMKKSNDICMEQVVGEDDDDESDSVSVDEGGENSQQHPQHDDDDDSSADIARLEAEEKAAIQNGMKALSLFFDPERKHKKKSVHDGDNTSEEDNHDNVVVISAEEDNIIGDNCYFYPAADTDRFNQRPLPFIVGSREFMESSCILSREED